MCLSKKMALNATSWLLANVSRRLMLFGLAMVIFIAGQVQAQASESQKIPVLIYHQIVKGADAGGETSISLQRFTEQMQHLHDAGYTTVSTRDLVAYMKGDIKLPKKSIVLTFDDGWKNVLSAVPILNKLHFKASFWIITERGIGWSNVEWSDVIALSKNPNFEVYSHTATHPWDPKSNLVTWVDGNDPRFGPADALRELVESKRLLEDKLGMPVPYLAWPVGWYNDRLVKMAKQAGYTGLLSAEDGANGPGDDVYQIKRLFVDGACDLPAFIRLIESHRYEPCAKGLRVTRGHSPAPYRQ